MSNNATPITQEQYISAKIIQGLQSEIGLLTSRVFELQAKEELYVSTIEIQKTRIAELEGPPEPTEEPEDTNSKEE